MFCSKFTSCNIISFVPILLITLKITPFSYGGHMIQLKVAHLRFTRVQMVPGTQVPSAPRNLCNLLVLQFLRTLTLPPWVFLYTWCVQACQPWALGARGLLPSVRVLEAKPFCLMLATGPADSQCGGTSNSPDSVFLFQTTSFAVRKLFSLI